MDIVWQRKLFDIAVFLSQISLLPCVPAVFCGLLLLCKDKDYACFLQNFPEKQFHRLVKWRLLKQQSAAVDIP